jgi:hypothetical protein
VDTHVGHTDSGSDWSCRYRHVWSRKLREMEVQLGQLPAAHLHCHHVTTWIARLGTRCRDAVTVEYREVIQVPCVQRRRLVSVLVRCGTVVMRLMVVAGVLVDVQRRQDAWCGDQSRNQQGCQRTPHADKSMRGTMEGQPTWLFDGRKLRHGTEQRPAREMRAIDRQSG